MDWNSLEESVRQQFVNQWGEAEAQARWEWEHASSQGQQPAASWEEYAAFRGVPGYSAPQQQPAPTPEAPAPSSAPATEQGGQPAPAPNAPAPAPAPSGDQPAPDDPAPAAPPPGNAQPGKNSVILPGQTTPTDLSDVDGDTLQLYFNNLLLLAERASKNLGDQGFIPEMVWNPSLGQFVPNGKTVQTLSSVKQAFEINRQQIDQVARIYFNTGRVPRTKLDANGMIAMDMDANGQPILDETLDSRIQRLDAGRSVGFVGADLLRQPGGTGGPAASSVTPGGTPGPAVANPNPPDAAGGQPKPDAEQPGAASWNTLDEGTRQGFVNQWGDRYAQARWEWEHANNAGENPGEWEAYAAYRGVPVQPTPAGEVPAPEAVPATTIGGTPLSETGQPQAELTPGAGTMPVVSADQLEGAVSGFANANAPADDATVDDNAPMHERWLRGANRQSQGRGGV